MNRATKPRPVPSKGIRSTQKDRDTKKVTSKQPVVVRQGNIKRKAVPRRNPEKEVHPRISSSDSRLGTKKNGLKTYQISSTPLNTPLKQGKKVTKTDHATEELECLSDISKDSPRSSVCSSVSSGLIELLYNYNAESMSKKKEEVNVAEIDSGPLDDTLKNENTFSFVIPTDQPNCDGRIKILSTLLSKLKSTANSILSSGDSRNVRRLEKLADTMANEFESLKSELPGLWVQKREFEAEVEAIVSPLKSENAALQRKIRILNQNLAEKENENDINLELETVQCMNNTLTSQVKKLSSLLQEVTEEKKNLENEVSGLKLQNKKLNEDLLYKNVEFSKSQEIFSTEAGTIKSEVANALQKVDALKNQLREAETETELMKVSMQQKDEEIARLNDLNKGLQSSVSRLLEDLQKARPRLDKTSRKVSSAILKNLSNVLNPPEIQPRDDDSFWNESIEYRPNQLTRSYPPRQENILPNGLSRRDQNFHKNSDMMSEDYENILESSRLSSIRTSETRSSAGEILSSGMHQPYDRSMLSSSVPRMKAWDQSSVSSSIASFTTRDENDFANGLALLDADIQRLQESLHDMSSKPT